MVHPLSSLAVPLDDDDSTSSHSFKREMDIMISDHEDDDLMMFAKKTLPQDVPMPIMA